VACRGKLTGTPLVALRYDELRESSDHFETEAETMCSKQISLQDVAAVLYDYWPEDCVRVRSALEAMANLEPSDDLSDVDTTALSGHMDPTGA